MHGVPKSLADEMLKDPRFNLSSTTGVNYFYMAIDSVGRSKVEALKNIKVREALMRAIDRKLIIKAVVPGGDPNNHVIPALCLRIQVGCDFSSQPPAFDRAKAKSLLKEAGYGEGFSLVINSFPGAYGVAEAVGGELRKIGVKATIKKLSFGAYRKAQKQGKQAILVAHWSSGGLPDASSTMNYWFSKTGRDFWRDDIIDGLRKKGDATIDVAKRREIYKQAYDRINEQRWIMPISLRPGVFIHTKEIEMDKIVISPIGFRLGGIRWK
jgi:peptide/nickel transport system substrate-binding protein